MMKNPKTADNVAKGNIKKKLQIAFSVLICACFRVPASFNDKPQITCLQKCTNIPGIFVDDFGFLPKNLLKKPGFILCWSSPECFSSEGHSTGCLIVCIESPLATMVLILGLNIKVFRRWVCFGLHSSLTMSLRCFMNSVPACPEENI